MGNPMAGCVGSRGSWRLLRHLRLWIAAEGLWRGDIQCMEAIAAQSQRTPGTNWDHWIPLLGGLERCQWLSQMLLDVSWHKKNAIQELQGSRQGSIVQGCKTVLCSRCFVWGRQDSPAVQDLQDVQHIEATSYSFAALRSDTCTTTITVEWHVRIRAYQKINSLNRAISSTAIHPAWKHTTCSDCVWHWCRTNPRRYMLRV